MAAKKHHLFDDPANVKRVLYLLYSCGAVLLGLDFILRRHAEHAWESVPAFYPLYGFVGCVILVLVAKWMRKGLMRPQDYYDREEIPDRTARGERSHVDT